MRHSVSRIVFLLLGSTAIPAVCQAQSPAAAPRPEFHAQAVRPNLYVLSGSAGNVAVWTGPTATVLVDDGTAALAPQLLEAVGRIAKSPVRFVVDTHWHPDHSGGNEALAKAGAIIVAHESVRERMGETQVDEDSGALFVDRFMATSMHYPCNYGYIPQTLADDGDPVDVLVVTPVPLIPGVVVTCRPLGMLKMIDEAGGDNKLLAVPIDRILSIYSQWKKPEDLNPMRLKTIQHFFEHYKDLEQGKWVKVEGWVGTDGAREEVTGGMQRWAAKHNTAS